VGIFQGAKKMQLHSTKQNSVLTLVLSGLLLAACSDGYSNGNSGTSATPRATGGEPNEGLYQANLSSLNTAVAGATQGTALLKVDGKFAASILVNNSPASISHRQYITTGTRCPVASDDVNKDGLLDSSEVTPAIGQYLIPLDDNLEAQSAGGKFPIANAAGTYLYNEEALLDTMLADLYLTDTNTSDNTVKLPAEENLNLAGKVVIVQSVTSSRTLPIACGLLSRVDTSTPFPLKLPVSSWPWDSSFSTRLSGELLISGQRCKGGETTQVIISGREILIPCPAGKWLVIVDNFNRCSPEGLCTEVAVSPVVTDLRKSSRPSASTLAFYNFIPRSPLSTAQALIMKKHWVRFNLNGEPLVLEK
jgi:hypothetical protein